MNSRRLKKAILIAPLTIYPFFVVPLLFTRNSAADTFISGVIAVFVAYFAIFFFGLPAVLVLDRYRATKWWHVTLAGAIGGACLSGGFGSYLFAPSVYCGAAVAAAAWFIACRPLPGDYEQSVLGQSVLDNSNRASIREP